MRLQNTTRIALAAAAALTLSNALPARAGTVTWNGGGSDLNWNNPANWAGGVRPDDIANFGETGYVPGDTINAGADQTINRLNYNFSSTSIGPTNVTIAGNTITLNGLANANNVVLGLARQNTVSGVQTINSNLLLGATQQWNVNGNANATDGGGRLIVNGVIGETPGGAKGLTKSGSQPLELNGDNTFTGPVVHQQNTLVLGNDHALGRGTSMVLVGNTANNNQQANLYTKTGVTFARDVLVRSGTTGAARLGGAGGQTSSTWTGQIALNRDASLTGAAGGNGPNGVVTFQGNVVNGSSPDNAFVSSNVTKVNGGTVKLAGTNNTYSGTTTVSEGTLLVNGVLANGGGGAVSVSAGARLGGTGLIDRAVNVAAGATIAPGDGGAGTLTIVGPVLTLGDGAVYEWEPGTSSDRVNASTVSFGATTTLKLLDTGFAPNPSASYALLTWSGADPASLATWTIDPASAFTGNVSYVGAGDGLPGGQVVLSGVTSSLVPEPSSAALLFLGVVGLARRRRTT